MTIASIMELRIYDYAVLVVLTVWFVLSILNQLSWRWVKFIRQYDYFSFLPFYTFFAPNPGQTDYHIAFRDVLADGSMTSWEELHLAVSRKGIACAIWNPTKRASKVLSDVASNVAASCRENQYAANYIVLSIPYLVALNLASQGAASPTSVKRQFAIVETLGFNRNELLPRVLLRSEFHPVDHWTITGTCTQSESC